MLFNSYEYLLYFLPLTLLAFFFFGRRRRAWALIWLVAASLFFYGWWNPSLLPLLVVSIAFNFAVARMLATCGPNRRTVLTVAIISNLLLLTVFKYSTFLAEIVTSVTGLQLPHLSLPLPLGISFFTFTQIAFLLDVYDKSADEPNPTNYVLFVSFFPHLLAGPIIHHREMMPQFASQTNKTPQIYNLSSGLFLLVVGLAKKVLLADQFAPIADVGFAAPSTVSTLGAWTAVLAYTMQIYFDFSGYTDMALGAAKMFNIHLPINFDSPYRSTNIREFWQRWHITLSRFLRQYLYIPLGGNRASESRVVVNLLVTFLIGGLWHGAAWTFLVWGILHGLGMASYRVWQRTHLTLPRWLAWGITFAFVMATWVFFRARSLTDAVDLVCAMFGLQSGQQASSGLATWWEALKDTASAASNYSSSISLVPVAIGLTVVWLRRNSNVMAADFKPTVANGLFVAVALPLCVLQLAKPTPFLYFNF